MGNLCTCTCMPCTCTCILYICMCMYIVGIYVSIYTCTYIQLPIYLPFVHSVGTAFCRTVMPKLKYPFLMKSPFHNDVKMQALHVHVVFLFVVVLYKPLCRTALSTLSEGTSSNSPVKSVNYMYPACMRTAGLSNRVCPVVCLSLCLSTKKSLLKV